MSGSPEPDGGRRGTPISRWSLRWASAISLLVVAGGIFRRSPLRYADGEAVPEGIELVHPLSYLLLAPVHGVIDTISILALDQHIAAVASVLLLYAGWRILRRGGERSPGGRIAVEAAGAAAVLGILGAIYLTGMFVYRPMARLTVDDPATVVVDIHSHTAHSHDGRRVFTTERNRSWHAGAGYDLGFISDHRTWKATPEALAGNPATAGGGTVLLPAMETRYLGRNVVMIGEEARYREAVNGEGNLEPGPLLARARAGEPSTIVVPLPVGLSDLTPATPDFPVGLVGIEVNDASPKGLEQSRSQRRRILRLADSLDLAVLAGSNTHGLGSTAAAWTLFRIPGWRELPPEEVGARIESLLREERRDAARVVERWLPYPGSSPREAALTLPAVGWHLFAALSLPERASWLVWTWLLAGGIVGLSRFRRGRRRPASGIRGTPGKTEEEEAGRA